MLGGNPWAVGILTSLIASAVFWLILRIRRPTLFWRAHRILSSADKYLDDALAILQSRSELIDSELDDAEDIRRWLDEDHHAASCAGESRIQEYMLISHCGDTVGAVFWGTYYPLAGMLFASYLARNKTLAHDEARQCHFQSPTRCVFERIAVDLRKGFLRNCRGIVFEIENPTHEANRPTLDERARARAVALAKARRRLFVRELTRWDHPPVELNIPYVQPSLDLQGAKPPQPMSLFFASMDWTRMAIPDSLPLRDVAGVVSFVFDHLYHDAFEHTSDIDGITAPLRSEYYARLERTKRSIMDGLPDPVSVTKHQEPKGYTVYPGTHEGDMARVYDDMACDYDDLKDLWYAWLFSRLHLLIAKKVLCAWRHTGVQVLDAGCGTGFQSFLYAAAGADVTGVDIAGKLVAVAEEKARHWEPRGVVELFPAHYEFVEQSNHEVTEIVRTVNATGCYRAPQFVVGSVLALPQEDGAFDHVNCCGSVLSSVEDHDAALRELARVLRPGGTFVFEVEAKYNCDLVWMLVDALLGGPLGYDMSVREAWKLISSGPNRHMWIDYPFGDPDKPTFLDIRLFSQRQFRRDCLKHGLRVEYASSIHAVTNVLPSTWLDTPNPSSRLQWIFHVLRRFDERMCSLPGCSLVVVGRKTGL